MKIFLPLALLLLGVTAQKDHGLTVRTKQGQVVGRQTSPRVRRFLGIPYAVARRWEAPGTPPKHSEPFNASNFSNSCPELIGPLDIAVANITGNNDAAIPPDGEDCLTVNVWAPSTNRTQGGAVLLWIYGGGFESGTTNTFLYDGSKIVENFDDILVVSFNYRTNIFGQPNAPQLVSNTKSQNFGFLDIDAAIQWVYDNIASFGGNPERITLFGESAGGVAADAYAYMHPDDHRIKGLIQMSGNLGAGWPNTTGPTPANVTFYPKPWNTVANVVGCGTVSDDNQLTCMKDKPFRTLVQALLDTNTTLVPLVDGITIFPDAGVRAASGKFLQVPLLAGTTSNEEDVVIVAAQVAALGYTLPFVTEVFSEIVTQITFVCPTKQAVENRLNLNIPTWKYLYEAVFKDISPRPDLRAFHSSELPVLFGALSPDAPQIEKDLSRYFQGAWVAFARDPHKGLLEYGWPQYESKTDSLARLGNFYNASGISFSRGELFDDACKDPKALVELLNKVQGYLPMEVLSLLGL